MARIAHGDQDIDLGRHKLGSHAAKKIGALAWKTMHEDDRPAIYGAEIGKALLKRFEVRAFLFGIAGVPEHTHSCRWFSSGLRTSDGWTCQYGAADQ